MTRAASVTLAVTLAVLTACSNPDEPAKSPEQVAADQAAAREQAKQGALGTQLQALDKAAAVQGTVDAQGEATRDAVDQQTGAAVDPVSDGATPATSPPP